MTKTVFLGAILSVVMMISIAGYSYATGDHVTIETATTDDSSRSATIDLAGNVNAATPDAYGYGIFASNGVVALTTHAGADDSAKQGNDPSPAFHTHLVTGKNTANCASNFAVNTASFNEVADFRITNDKISITNIDASAGELSELVVAFTLTFENGEVCINPTSTNTP